jgi:uncharacterized repeat protein (TIGR01451 family)
MPKRRAVSLARQDGERHVNRGGAISYTVTVSNMGTGPATNVVVSDNLANILTSVGASSTVGSCSVGAANLVICNVGTLNAGQSVQIAINATAPSGTCPTITNRATGSHSGGNTNRSDVAVAITELTDSFNQTTLDLLAAKCPALAGLTLNPDESVTCTFTLHNYSPAQGTRS